MTVDDFQARDLSQIKKAQSNDDLIDVIDAIYHDGFEDGAAEGTGESE